MPVRERIRSSRGWAAAATVCLLAVACGVLPSPGSAGPDVGPGTLRKVSTGIALIRLVGCDGKALGTGTGFLVGESVVMTARHLLAGACTVRVTVNGKTVTGRRWVSWSGARASAAAADLATIKLDAPVKGAHVFTIRPTSPATGTTLGTAAYLRGARLTVAQGKVTWRGLVKGAPLVAVRMPGARGADGAPLVDDAGRVVGVLRLGIGSRGVLGQRRSGEVEGLDLARWWGPKASTDLCNAYPKGGIVGCPGDDPASDDPAPDPGPAPATPSTPDQPDEPDEPVAPDPSGPPPSPTGYVIEACWAQYTADSWDNALPSGAATSFAAGELVAKGPTNYWSVVQLATDAPAAISGVTASLVSPGGFVSPGAPFTWEAGADRASQDFAWRLAALGVWFFQNPTYPPPARWLIRWSFPNGQSCETPFTVT